MNSAPCVLPRVLHQNTGNMELFAFISISYKILNIIPVDFALDYLRQVSFWPGQRSFLLTSIWHLVLLITMNKITIDTQFHNLFYTAKRFSFDWILAENFYYIICLWLYCILLYLWRWLTQLCILYLVFIMEYYIVILLFCCIQLYKLKINSWGVWGGRGPRIAVIPYAWKHPGLPIYICVLLTA